MRSIACRTHWSRALVPTRFAQSLYVPICGALMLACSSDDGADDGSPAPPFGGMMPTPSESTGGMPGLAGSAGIQGSPEMNPIGAPLVPGIGMPSNNGIGGAPPEGNAGAPPEGNAGAPPEGNAGGSGPVAQPGPPALENVLVFSRTAGFPHDSIPAGTEAIRALGAANGFAVEQTADPALFTEDRLAEFDVVVFLCTTMDVLDEAQQGAFERYIQSGGGWVGVHAATDTEYGWPWYGQLIGGNAWFKSHPAITTVTLNVELPDHASTAHLPESFQLQDEWYNFQANPRPFVTVLLTLDETSYAPGVDAMGDHPIAWFHEFDGGRAWYTGLGHRQELYADPLFTQHLLGGIRWAAGVVP